MKEQKRVRAKAKPRRHSISNKRLNARLQHRERTIGMAMVELMSRQEATAMLSDALKRVRVAAVVNLNSAFARLRRRQTSKTTD